MLFAKSEVESRTDVEEGEKQSCPYTTIKTFTTKPGRKTRKSDSQAGREGRMEKGKGRRREGCVYAWCILTYLSGLYVCGVCGTKI